MVVCGFAYLLKQAPELRLGLDLHTPDACYPDPGITELDLVALDLFHGPGANPGVLLLLRSGSAHIMVERAARCYSTLFLFFHRFAAGSPSAFLLPGLESSIEIAFRCPWWFGSRDP